MHSTGHRNEQRKAPPEDVRDILGWFVLQKYWTQEFKLWKMSRSNVFFTNFILDQSFLAITSGLEWNCFSPMVHLRCVMNSFLHKAPLYGLTKYIELSPPKTEAYVQVLKTTNQPVSRNSHSFRCTGTERLQNCSKSNGTGLKNKQQQLTCMMFPGITLPNKENCQICGLTSSSLGVLLWAQHCFTVLKRKKE